MKQAPSSTRIPPASPPSAPPVAPPAGPPVYHEVQHFRQWWLWVLIVAPAAGAWWPFIAQVIGGRPVGQNPAPDWAIWLIWLFIGLGLPVVFSFVALVIEVFADRILIRYRPFYRRAIPVAEVERVEARTYNALKEYGGWGIKGWSKTKIAYNVSGDRGVDLTLTDDRRVLLGSQRADELAAAIDSRRAAARAARRA
jgi:hypothetical protein